MRKKMQDAQVKKITVNHAHAEIARVGIRYSLFQKQEENHRHQQ